MKKLFLIPILLLTLLFSACQAQDNDSYSSALKLDIQHISESDDNKTIDIAYPVFGGISNKEAITIINTSISNYVTSEYDEFQNALTNTAQSVITDTATTDTSDTSDTTDTADDSATTNDDSTDTTGNTTTDTTTSGSGGEEPISLSMSFKITYDKNDYLCIVQTFKKELGENKTFVGQRSFFFSLENATYLSLDEVFDFDTDFTTYINDAIKTQLANDNYTTYDGDSGFTGISKDCNFYFDNDYLYIYYNALEIGPDMDVIPTFAFKIKDVEKYLNEDFTNIF